MLFHILQRQAMEVSASFLCSSCDVISLIRFSLASPWTSGMAQTHFIQESLKRGKVYTEYVLHGTQFRLGMEMSSIVPKVKIALFLEDCRRGTWHPVYGGYLTQLPRTNRANVISGYLQGFNKGFPEQRNQFIFDQPIESLRFGDRIEESLRGTAALRKSSHVSQSDIDCMVHISWSVRLATDMQNMLRYLSYEDVWLESNRPANCPDERDSEDGSIHNLEEMEEDLEEEEELEPDEAVEDFE
eukprot:TRINITY_DN77190_c0_g1_i1.p1 TRINITY_DN77190_c0_g1~~TRINITY_DN77190_c0_g1_i1.p1  ORF type:complete len:243 (+),score=39.17 TRINITY_DN77190_c0_g1_i1:61-789(+)